jgi:hypothetical protein
MTPARPDEASGTPLTTKLGVTPGSRLALLWAPPDVVVEVPESVRVVRRAATTADVTVAFCTDRRRLEGRIGALARDVFPDRALWVAWPKRTSGLRTTVDEHVIRELALPLGLVDNKVCAIDARWSGLRLVWRREHRGASPPSASYPSRRRTRPLPSS